MQKNVATADWSVARRRGLVLASLIAVVTLFWVVMLLFTNLPVVALAGIAVLGIFLLSVATAWTAMALPRRGASSPVAHSSSAN